MTTSAVDAVKQVLKVQTVGPSKVDEGKLSMEAVDQLDESREMLAAVWNGKKTVDVIKRPVPKITDPVRLLNAQALSRRLRGNSHTSMLRVSAEAQAKGC